MRFNFVKWLQVGGHEEHPGRCGPEAVQLQHHGGHERIHRLGLATAAANYGLKTVVDQHSLDIAARISWGPCPPQRWPPSSQAETPPSRGLQASKADALLSAVDTSSEVDSLNAALASARRQGGQRAGLPALHGGRVGHSTGGGHQDSKCSAGPRH